MKNLQKGRGVLGAIGSIQHFIAVLADANDLVFDLDSASTARRLDGGFEESGIATVKFYNGGISGTRVGEKRDRSRRVGNSAYRPFGTSPSPPWPIGDAVVTHKVCQEHENARACLNNFC